MSGYGAFSLGCSRPHRKARLTRPTKLSRPTVPERTSGSCEAFTSNPGTPRRMFPTESRENTGPARIETFASIRVIR